MNELLRYDIGRSALVWRKSSGRARAESIAGYQNTNGWRRIVIDKKPYSAYRILHFMLTGEDTGTTIFRPVNGDWHDLRLENGKARTPRLASVPTPLAESPVPDPQAPEAEAPRPPAIPSPFVEGRAYPA